MEEKRNKTTMYLDRIKNISTVLIPFISAIVLGLHRFFKKQYSQQIEEFFGVPKEYFYDISSAQTMVFIVLFLIVISFFIFAPLVLSKKSKEENSKGVIYVLSLVLNIYYVYLYSFRNYTFVE